MRISVRDIQKLKANHEPIPTLTAYDATSAFLGEAAGIPLLLVGDSLGMVIQGHQSTIPVTLEQIIYHSTIVVRATQKAMVVGDLPFMSYQLNPEQALASAGRLLQEAGVNAVKLEGGETMAGTIRRIVDIGIPVMAHIGLTPQSVNRFGGFRVQGREITSAKQLLRDAQAVQDAGAFAVVLELVAAPLAEMITARLEIPTIGIGAGAGCDGQIQVFHDLLGLHPSFGPRHAKQYFNAGAAIEGALRQYVEEVKSRQFPALENGFAMSEEVLAALQSEGEQA